MDIFYLQKLFFCLGVLMIEISAYDQTYQLGLKDAEKFFSDDLSVPNVRYVDGEAFVGTKKVGLAISDLFLIFFNPFKQTIQFLQQFI